MASRSFVQWRAPPGRHEPRPLHGVWVDGGRDGSRGRWWEADSAHADCCGVRGGTCGSRKAPQRHVERPSKPRVDLIKLAKAAGVAVRRGPDLLPRSLRIRMVEVQLLWVIECCSRTAARALLLSLSVGAA
jgi:hypothetical protein